MICIGRVSVLVAVIFAFDLIANNFFLCLAARFLGFRHFVSRFRSGIRERNRIFHLESDRLIIRDGANILPRRNIHLLLGGITEKPGRGKVIKMKEEDHFSYSGPQIYSLGSSQDQLGTVLDRNPVEQSGASLIRGPQESETAASQDEADRDSESSGNSQNQLVVYSTSDKHDIVPSPNPDECESRPLASLAPPVSSRVLPDIGAFAVQCASCFKWRLIPTKEKYEEIRENILQEPFICETAQEWRPDISCDNPADIYQDGSRLWAIDKPNISQPPPGWQRLLRIRGEGSTRFADVYYVTPSGKRLRSMVEIEKYLCAHPEYIKAGVTMSQFSFQIPKPLQENYVRKRPSAKLSRLGNGTADETSRHLEPSEVSSLSWASPGESSNHQHLGHRQGQSPSLMSEPPIFDPLWPPLKKTRQL